MHTRAHIHIHTLTLSHNLHTSHRIFGSTNTNTPRFFLCVCVLSCWESTLSTHFSSACSFFSSLFSPTTHLSSYFGCVLSLFSPFGVKRRVKKFTCSHYVVASQFSLFYSFSFFFLRSIQNLQIRRRQTRWCCRYHRRNPLRCRRRRRRRHPLVCGEAGSSSCHCPCFPTKKNRRRKRSRRDEW